MKPDTKGEGTQQEPKWDRLEYYREIHKLDLAALERYRIRLLAGMDKIEAEYKPSTPHQEQTAPVQDSQVLDYLEKVKNERNDYLAVLRSGLKNHPTLNIPFTEEIEGALKKYKKL